MQARQPVKARLTTSEFSAKFRSKNEVYSFLSCSRKEWGLPPDHFRRVISVKILHDSSILNDYRK